MIKLNKETLRDKIYACWIGKNIGGTMGTPYEGTRELLDIQGFSTPEGVVLPNDDLDLQLAWLLAMEEHGPYQLNAQILGEYWLAYVVPHWNEYGIGKGNMKAGLLPPLAGHYRNMWKDSNGAWIRSEVWACLAPGCPDAAIRYAVEDACVDHGMGEGTYAEFFTAALESAAFVVQDIRQLIEIGLSKIPPDCRVARSVRLAVDSYDKGVDWKKTRQLIMEDSADLGWFQAPANVAYVILGLLYGEGDFKKSMILSINCGDDTDCTGATLGSVFGILNGTAGIPEDWKKHIGDEIITISLNNADRNFVKNCTDLTDHVFSMAPVVLKANRAAVQLTDGPDEIPSEDIAALKQNSTVKKLWERPGYSYTVDFIHASGRVEFDEEPVIAPGGSLPVRIVFQNHMHEVKHLHVRLHLPEGFTASYPRDVYLNHQFEKTAFDRYHRLPEGFQSDLTQVPGPEHMDREAIWEGTITAGEQVDAMNRIIAEVTCDGHPTVGLIPITILG